MPTREDTLGRMLIRDASPPEIRHLVRPMTKRDQGDYFQALAETHPDQYRAVAKRIADIALNTDAESSGYSFGPHHLAADPGTRALLDQLKVRAKQILSDPQLSQKQRDAELIRAAAEHSGAIEDQVMGAATAANNPFALQVRSGAKGKAENLKSLIAGDTLYSDANQNLVPFPVTHSFYEGLRPHEYYAGTFGARYGLIMTKLCLAEGTLVQLADGTTRAIEAISVGEQVIGADENGVTGPTYVTACYSNGLRLCSRYTFRREEDGAHLELVATPDHRVLGYSHGTQFPRLIALRDVVAIARPRQAWHGGPLESWTVCGVERPRALATFDLEVEYSEHMFLLASGLIVSNSTADGGWFAKRVANAAHRLVVTAPDAEAPPDPETPRGLPVDTADPHNEHALLAAPAGGHARDTLLTREILGQLKKKGIEKILVRSPTVGGPGDGGVYGKDAGVRERGSLAPVGDFVGRAAADAISEPISQVIIGCLVAGTKVRMADRTEKAIEQIELGEWVLGANEAGETFATRVTRTYDHGTKPCVRTAFIYGLLEPTVYLESTLDHKVLATTERPRIAATADPVCRQIPVGEAATSYRALAIYRRGERDDRVYLTRRVQEPIGMCATYDIEVECASHLFVLANGLVVSNSKHGGGVAGTATTQQGFPVIDRLVSIPSTFQGGAAHAQKDGSVAAVRAAPQGGHYVVVDGAEHYVPPDQKVTVAPGDKVEAGDTLSDGIENPAEIVAHKGIGEGRRRFVNNFMKVASASGVRPLLRRNVEMIARGLIDHVKLDREWMEYAPGDVIPYHQLEAHYVPRDGSSAVVPKDAVGQFLEAPALHYTIGTRITPSMLAQFDTHGVRKLTVHPAPPPFAPLMIRSQDTLRHDRDWGTQMLGSGLQKSLLQSTARNATADPYGTSYVPALMQGVEFGEKGKTVGWDNSTTK